MTSQSDRSVVDKENFDYFKALLRHMQSIPDDTILLFRQEVDQMCISNQQLSLRAGFAQNLQPPQYDNTHGATSMSADSDTNTENSQTPASSQVPTPNSAEDNQTTSSLQSVQVEEK